MAATPASSLRYTNVTRARGPPPLGAHHGFLGRISEGVLYNSTRTRPPRFSTRGEMSSNRVSEEVLGEVAARHRGSTQAGSRVD